MRPAPRTLSIVRLTRRSAGLVALAFALTGCDELVDLDPGADAGFADAGDVGADIERDLGPDPYEALTPVPLRFALDTDDFFDIPWPSDLRRRDDGTLDLATFPDNGSALLEDYIALLERDVTGHALMPAFYALGDEALAEVSLPTPAETLGAQAGVQLVRLDGCAAERVPIEVEYRAEGDNYAPDHLLVAGPVPGFALEPGVRYAFLVLRTLGNASGLSAAPSASLVEGLDGEGALAGHLAPLIQCLPALELNARDIASVAVFTTQNPLERLRGLRDAVWAGEAPVVTAFEEHPTSGTNGRRLYTGRFDTPIYQEGTSPYANEGGAIRFVDGEPVFVRMESVPFSVLWRESAGPTYRPLLWSGGTGATELGWASSRLTEDLLDEGFIVFNYVAQFHGSRATPGSEPSVSSFNVVNGDAFRNVFRQQVADASFFLRLLRDGRAQLPALPEVDDERVVYAGHSQGAVVGAMLAAVETEIDAYYFNGLSSYLASTVMTRTDPVDFAFLVVGLGNLRGELYERHPLLALIQTLGEAADSVSYVRRWQGWDGHPDGVDVFVTNGVSDATTSVRSMSGLTVLADLPPLAPAGWDPDPSDVWGVPDVSLPVRANRTAPSGAGVTRASLLSDSTGHFTVQQRGDVRDLAVGFLRSAAEGDAAIE